MLKQYQINTHKRWIVKKQNQGWKYFCHLLPVSVIEKLKYYKKELMTEFKKNEKAEKFKKQMEEYLNQPVKGE